MKKRFIILLVIVNLFSHFSFAKKPSAKFISKANKFLTAYVHEGQVDYYKIKKSPSELNDLLKLIASIDIESEKENAQKAFYINVYNLLVIKSIVNSLPVIAPLERKGIFSSDKFTVGKKEYTLNEIEALLISRFKDMRVMFLLSSGSYGAPKLASYAYEPKKLEKQLEERSKLICNDKEFIRVAKNISTILMAESFIKLQREFKKEEIVTTINKFREEPLPDGYMIEFYPIRRQLNLAGVQVW